MKPLMLKPVSRCCRERRHHLPLVSPEKAIELLGTMQGGYNIHPLIDALDDAKLAPIAAKALSHTLLMFDNLRRRRESQSGQ